MNNVHLVNHAIRERTYQKAQYNFQHLRRRRATFERERRSFYRYVCKGGWYNNTERCSGIPARHHGPHWCRRPFMGYNLGYPHFGGLGRTSHVEESWRDKAQKAWRTASGPKELAMRIAEKKRVDSINGHFGFPRTDFQIRTTFCIDSCLDPDYDLPDELCELLKVYYIARKLLEEAKHQQ